MKVFFRSLFIEEKQIFHHILYFAICNSFTIFFIGVLKEFFYITPAILIGQAGSFFILITLIKTIKNISHSKLARNKLLKIKDFQALLYKTVLYFFQFSIYIICLFNFNIVYLQIILRFSPFLNIIVYKFNHNEHAPIKLFLSFLVYVVVLIILVATYTEEYNIMNIVLIVILIFIFIYFNNENDKNHNKDLNLNHIMCLLGIISSASSTFFVIFYYSNVPNINLTCRILIFFISLLLFCSIYFQIKIHKSNLESTVNFLPISSISVIVNYVLAVLFSKIVFSIADHVMVLLIAISIKLFYDVVSKKRKMNINDKIKARLIQEKLLQDM